MSFQPCAEKTQLYVRKNAAGAAAEKKWMVSLSESGIRVAGLNPESIVDGVGLRFTVFTQGCPHHCEGCHNPQTHAFEGGTFYTAEELLARITRNPLISGVTFSGGEPFAQAEELLPLARGIKEKGLNLCAYSGYTFEQLLKMESAEKLLRLCDVLVDGPFILSERTLQKRFAGSRNQRILDVAASLEAGEPVLMEGWQTPGF